MVSERDSTDTPTCANCGGALERIEENTIDIAGEEVTFYADRCTSCRNEFVNAPAILRPDEELISNFRPTAGPLGFYRRITTLASRTGISASLQVQRSPPQFSHTSSRKTSRTSSYSHTRE